MPPVRIEKKVEEDERYVGLSEMTPGWGYKDFGTTESQTKRRGLPGSMQSVPGSQTPIKDRGRKPFEKQ